ncbi:hypothetical protein FHS37_007816, partial [Streptomyces griseostramineus]
DAFVDLLVAFAGAGGQPPRPSVHVQFAQGGGRRRRQAARRASATSSVLRWSAVAQPTTRREATSMTVAR